MLHKIHCIQSGCIGPRCMDSTAYKRNPLHQNVWNILHSMTLHVIHCIQSGRFGQCCKKSTEFNRDALGLTAWTPLHTIRIHCATMHGILCSQSGCILPGCMESMHSSCCMNSTAYNRDPLRHNALNTLHSMMLHGIHCIQSGCFGPCCIKSTAFNHAPLNPLHSIRLHKIHCIQ